MISLVVNLPEISFCSYDQLNDYISFIKESMRFEEKVLGKTSLYLNQLYVMLMIEYDKRVADMIVEQESSSIAP